MVPLNDRRGIAGLFDALIFLAIASLVSASLIASLSAHGSSVEARNERIDTAHTVLLRSTVNDSRGNPVTIEELFKLRDSGGSYEDHITAVLDLLLPRSGWRWSVERGEHRWTFGSGSVPEGDVICSVLRAPIGDQEVVYRLDAWPLR